MAVGESRPRVLGSPPHVACGHCGDACPQSSFVPGRIPFLLPLSSQLGRPLNLLEPCPGTRKALLSSTLFDPALLPIEFEIASVDPQSIRIHFSYLVYKTKQLPIVC